jgi:hypothetical protein
MYEKTVDNNCNSSNFWTKFLTYIFNVVTQWIKQKQKMYVISINFIMFSKL